MRKKYPSTPHLPFSRSVQADDIMGDTFAFYGQECVVTTKMDGENTTMYRDGSHARSMDSVTHPSRSWARAFHGANSWKIPENVRVIAENMYAEHSIRYENLDSFLYGIAVVEDGMFWGWDESEMMFEELGIPSVPVLWRGVATPKVLLDIAKSLDTNTQEGFVVRTATSFPEIDFANNVAKWVRPHHVQTDEFWMNHWVPNKMRDTIS